MNKNALKSYAVWARQKLINDVAQKAFEYAITKDGFGEENAKAIGERALSNDEVKQRSELVNQIKLKGFEQVMEEVAYTWFNRFIALRYMEVNGFLPSRIRVFTNENNEFKPEILKEAINIDFECIDKSKVFELIDSNDTDALYKYLIISQCNDLGKLLPGMFEKISNYTELLFPNNLLRQDSVLGKMVSDIPEEDWTDQVQIIGWLYQFYNSELKDETYAHLAKKVKLTKEKIPAVTQLFTPDWIVRYMVENSLGRLWYEGHPDDSMKTEWKYYLDEAEQEEEVQKQLDEIKAEYAKIKPEEIKIIDPCMGSGHILVYAFDVLMQIYLSQGWNERDAAKSIVENNLYGIDIDDRAYQLAYFAVMMKARSYSRRILNQNVKYNLCAITDSNDFNEDYLELFGTLKNSAKRVIDEFKDAKEYGSILNVKTELTYLYALQEKLEEIKEAVYDNLFDNARRGGLIAEFEPILKEAIALAQKYDVVVTNPPYVGKKSLNNKLSAFLDKYYPNGKTELYSAFIYKCSNMTKKNCYTSMITIHTWMFISSFKKLRENIISNENIVSMLHTGAATFEELNSFNVLATAFIRKKNFIEDYVGVYVKLTNYYNTKEKIHNFNNQQNTFFAKQNKFFYIQEQPIVYWLSDHIYNIFKNTPKIESFGNLTNGLFTCDNERFVRNWFEVSVKNIKFSCHSAEEAEKTGLKWFPYAKGGNFRKWYGNNEYVVNYQNNGFEIREYRTQQGQSRKFPGEDYYFMPGITWSPFGFENFGVRYKFYGDIFDIAGSSLFAFEKQKEKYILSFLASKIGFYFLSTVAPTVNFQIGNIGSLPLIDEQECMVNIDELASDNIEIAKTDWDSFENSWDFKEHPLVRLSKGLWDVTAVGASMHYYYGGHPKVGSPLELCYMLWQGECNERFKKLKANEEELNRIFIDIYGLQDELTPEVEDKDVTVRKADLQRDIKSLISYAVGCMLGRYSIEAEGLQYAGGNFNEWYNSLSANGYQLTANIVDKDNILPICDDEYFEDDIVGKFVEFVKVVYGEDTLEENLKFVADALGNKGKTSREVIRNYFLNDFYKDHCKTYQKRPIYWLFDSGKKNGFKALIYMHRYKADTIAKLRTDYVFEQQERYRSRIEFLTSEYDSATGSDRTKIGKEIDKIKEQLNEVNNFEEKVDHLADQMITIDLDDGVKVNYAKFEDVLAKVK